MKRATELRRRECRPAGQEEKVRKKRREERKKRREERKKTAGGALGVAPGVAPPPEPGGERLEGPLQEAPSPPGGLVDRATEAALLLTAVVLMTGWLRRTRPGRGPIFRGRQR